MNLDSFTGPGSTPSRRRFWDKVTAAVNASQKIQGDNVSVEEHQGQGTLINVPSARRRSTPSGTTGACCIDGECSITTEADCAGIYQGNGIPCSPNPCSGACCHTFCPSTDCETPDCSDVGGCDFCPGGADCIIFACDDVTPGGGRVLCCEPGVTDCATTTLVECPEGIFNSCPFWIEGTFYSDIACIDKDCTSAACCFPFGGEGEFACVAVTVESFCTDDLSGTFKGWGSVCGAGVGQEDCGGGCCCNDIFDDCEYVIGPLECSGFGAGWHFQAAGQPGICSDTDCAFCPGGIPDAVGMFNDPFFQNN